MRCTLAILLCLLVSPVFAQEKLTILPDNIDGVRAPKLLYTALLKQAKAKLNERKKVISDLKTPEQFHQRQADLKKKFIAALGGFPKKTPLNARVTGKLDRGDYRIEKVIYESQPNHHVTATLYIPKGKGPFPGVLVPCGHSSNGKASDAYQRASILMAKNGFVVLCYDPISQGERIQLLDKMGRPAIPGSTTEHTMVTVGALLVGKSAATYRIWDGIRSIDYLISRPEVDDKRIGCTGNSGGGTLTSYLMALDERITVAAPSCYITSLERLFETIGPQDGEQNITGQVAFGMDHVDYVTMRAPKPTLILCATKDFFDIKGTWDTFREAKLLYGMIGHGEKVSLFEYKDGHGFSQPRREAAVRWMTRWLYDKDKAITEPKFAVFSDAELQCTRSGQVMADMRGKSAFHLNAEIEKQLAPNRKADKEAIRKLIALPKEIPAAKVIPQGMISRKGYTIYQRTYETESGIPVPGLMFVPNKGKNKLPLILYLHEDGAAADAGKGGRIEKMVLAGNTVLAVDVRGMGETAPGPATRGLGKWAGADWREAFMGIHLNRPLLGQRTLDVLALVELLNAKPGVKIVAVGRTGPIALHAAAFDKRIMEVEVENALVSWADVVHNPLGKNHLGNVVPGALAVYDLPDVAGMIAPRPLTIRGSVSATGEAVAQKDLDAIYQPAQKAYGSKAKFLNVVAGR